jgi:hypothetical protein
MPMSTVLKKHYKSPFPTLNVHCHEEALATDTVYSDVSAVDSGVKDILRSLINGNWQSEPHQQHQNPSERKYQDVKRMANTIVDRAGSCPQTWLLALMYVCFFLNFTASASLNWRTPMEILTGSTPDISPLCSFRWWEPVYFKLDDPGFPSDSREWPGCFVGISEHVGHAMTYMILTNDTQKIIHRSNVRTALDPLSPNKQVDPPSGEDYQPTNHKIAFQRK